MVSERGCDGKSKSSVHLATADLVVAIWAARFFLVDLGGLLVEEVAR